MIMKLKIEEQHKGFLHQTLVAELERIARDATDLDEALFWVRASTSRDLWACGRGGHHVWLSLKGDMMGQREDFVRVATIEEDGEASREREWDDTKLTIGNAQQDVIARGDIVRAYDFPGSRDDVYIEGVVKERGVDHVMIHVTREVWEGREEQVGRFEVRSPLGVSSFNRAPCVFLIAKRKERS